MNIKSYTDIEQSRKLAEILPLESADMHSEAVDDKGDMIFIVVDGLGDKTKQNYGSPVWSLTALLDVLPKGTRLLKSATNDIYHCDCPKGNIYKWFNNPVDACVTMIEKLNELRLL